MKKICFQIAILSLLLSFGTAMASYSYRDYQGTGDFLVNSQMGNIKEQAKGSAEQYAGSQYITNDKQECYNYDICSYDQSNINNGQVDNQQTITNQENGESTETVYNTGLSGTGSLYAAIFSNSNQGYGYQYSTSNKDTYALFTQTHTENGNFDYQASYGGGTEDCDNGNVLMENSYHLVNSPTYYSPLTLAPNCIGTGCNFVYLYGNGTDTVNVNATFSTPTLSWFNSLNLQGSGIYEMFSKSDQPVNFTFGMVLG